MNPDSEDSSELDKLGAVLGIESSFLRQCVRYEAIRMDEIRQERAELPPKQVARLRRLQRICHSLDIDVFAGGIIVDLVERIHELQAASDSDDRGNRT